MPVRALATLLLVLGLGPARAEEEHAGGARPAYPETRRCDAHDLLHGVTVEDPYRWLESDADEEVVLWDAGQDSLLRQRLDAFPGREALAARIGEELDLPSMPSIPVVRGVHRFWTERGAGQAHAVLHVGPADDEQDPGRVLLDPNAWSTDGTEGLKLWEPSPDGRLVAYARDAQGSEATTLRVRDVLTGKDLADVLPRTKFTSLAWSPDARGFLYVRLPAPDAVPPGEAQLHRRVLWHRLGDLAQDDVQVAGRGRPRIEWPWVGQSVDLQHTFLGRERPDDFVDTFEVLWEPSGPRLEPLLLGHDSRTWITRTGDTYLVNTDHGAPRRMLATATRETVGEPARWKTLLAEGRGVIEDALPVGSHVAVHLREDVVSRLLLLPLVGGEGVEIPLPGPGSVSALTVRPGTSRIDWVFESWSRPRTRYALDVDPVSGKPSSPRAIASEPTTVETSRLVSSRRMYRSRDGTEIPLFLLHREDVALDGSAPTLLYGYGGFRVGLTPRFSAARALWAERGGVYAVACLRGGDEYGEAWHEQGSRGNKQNVFDDFIAAADWLVDEKIARRGRLAIEGGSNGGLLVAACLNQRPDLCRAAISAVPLTDMLRYHLFQYAEAWTVEYGSPSDPEAFAWLRAYSPYHNVRPAAFPAILVTAGLHDGRVNAFHARKIVARWQAATTSSHPVLLRVDRASGHGAASRRQYRDDLLDRLCFLFQELGAPEVR